MDKAQLRKRGKSDQHTSKSALHPSQTSIAPEPINFEAEEFSQSDLLRLQHTVGNQAVQRIMRSKSDDNESTHHEKGCGCPHCRSMMLKREENVATMVRNSPLVQRVDEHEEDIAAKRVDIRRVDEHEEDIAAKRVDIQRVLATHGNLSLMRAQHIQKKTPSAIIQWRVKPRIQRGWLSDVWNWFKGLFGGGSSKDTDKKAAKKDAPELGKGKDDLKKALTEIFDKAGKATLNQLKPIIAKASKAQKDAAWNDEEFLKKAKGDMSENDYLSLLPALGMFKKGKTAEDKKSHTRADNADKFIRKYLGGYVEAAAKAGRKVEGQVAVVDGDDWLAAYKREFGDDGEENITNAFVDHPEGRIWIHKNRGNAGTIIHEGIHKYSTGDFLSNVGFNFNEGITEFFTRKICKQLKYKRGNYESNYKFAVEFVALLGEANVAKAYFDGDVKSLKKLYTDKGKDWSKLVKAVKDKKWSEAKKLLKESKKK